MLFILLVLVVFTDRCTAASAQEKAVYSKFQKIEDKSACKLT